MGEWVGVCAVGICSCVCVHVFSMNAGDMCINGGGGWESVSVYVYVLRIKT